MTPPTIADYLKYADLQMAAEAFIRDPDTKKRGRIEWHCLKHSHFYIPLHFDFLGWPFFLMSMRSSCLGLVINGNGFRHLFTARGSTLPARFPTVFSTIKRSSTFRLS